MGKRKDRRHAAMNASGRRVKLDLFAEPSGDLGGSSQDGVGREEDSKTRAELPNSPSSSGHQPENPLMLLGQYTDDELDEDSSEGPIRAGSEDSLAVHNDQVKVVFREDEKGAKSSIGSAMIVEDEGKENCFYSENLVQRAEEDEHKKSYALYSVEEKEMDVTSQNTTPGTFDTKVVGDVISGWKTVLHEESNQYYYWNVLTGETSWEVPNALIPTTESGNDEKVTDDIGVEDVGLKTHESHVKLNVKLEESNRAESCDASNDNEDCKMETLNEGHKCIALQEKVVNDDASLSDSNKMAGQLDSHQAITSPEVSSPKQSGDALLGHLSKPGDNAGKHQDAVSAGEFEIEADFSSHLIERCVSLLEKLKAVQGSKKSLRKDEQISEYMLEVEIRLADIRSLACNGLSLLPFWVHSEKRLKLLETAINEFSEQSDNLHGHEADAVCTSHHELTDDTKVNPNEQIATRNYCKELNAAQNAGIPVTRNDARVEVYNNDTSTNSGSDAIEEGEVVELAAHEELATKTVVQPGEEVDMDVDMEVEDAVPPPCDTKIGDASFGQSHLLLEKDMIPALQANEGSSLPDQTSIVQPPPPDEDWVPPPPPDDEPFPPPPPDEPPQTSYSQSSDLQSAQPFPYSLSYPVSGYEFYGQMNNVPTGSNLYSHAEGQMAVPYQQLYYEALPNAYSSDPMAVNAINPGVYYSFQGGEQQHVPVVVAADSSVLPSRSISENAISGPMGSFSTHTEVSSVSSIQNEKNGAVDVGTAGISSKFPTSQASFQGADNISTQGDASVLSSSSNPATATSAATASNIPSKVSRNKKRTVAVGSSLRSNKKVSSLVDKWKAAKEELHAEEEEPANAYEILEKKRQREIEEWRAQQIASGEAKDNANFQPLGGDWRERVKRRRAEKMKEAEQKPKTTTDVAEEKQQPDLNALSTGLPSEWKAYWDESTKQVYYGNVVTSETTWTKPTN